MKKLLKIFAPLLFASTLLSANNCANSIPLQEFLKETVKLEETIKFQKEKLALQEKENKALKAKIKKLESNKKAKAKKKKTVSGLYKVAWDEANIYINNAPKSFSPYSLVKEERVNIERCDEFGWCKLKGKKLYIKRHTITKAR